MNPHLLAVLDWLGNSLLLAAGFTFLASVQNTWVGSRNSLPDKERWLCLFAAFIGSSLIVMALR